MADLTNETLGQTGRWKDDKFANENAKTRMRFQYNEALVINRLPLELMCMILKELDLNDLLACEQVCQKWNIYVRGLNIQRLIIVKQRPKYKSRKIRPRKWFFVEAENGLTSKEMVRCDMKIELENSFLVHLKQLRVCNPRLNPLFEAKEDLPLLNSAKFVNQLTNLEVVEVSRFGFDQQDCLIDLPNLKCLAIHRLSSCRIRIGCPKLSSFRTKERFNESVEFLLPQTITHLYADFYSPEFAVFRGLEYISLKSSSFHNEHGDNDAVQFLTAFPRLRVISQKPSRINNWNESSLQELLKQKVALKRDDLMVIFFGVLVDHPAQLSEK